MPAIHPQITLVVAVARNGVIGADGGMPWRLPGELQRFRRITMGHPLIMGRRTHESIGRPLPGRTNIVLTRDPSFRVDGVTVATDWEKAVAAGAAAPGGENLMVIGGEAVFRVALPDAHVIELTRIDAEPEGDTFFPALGPEWTVAREEPAEEGGYPLRFQRLERTAE